MREALLSFDLGTTRFKAALFALDGALLKLAVTRHADTDDANGWWQAAAALTHQLRSDGALDDLHLLGISLSGRGDGAVFADEAGEIVANPWSDRRHAPALHRLRRNHPDFAPYGTAMIAKWLTLDDARARRAYYVKDWLLHKLTGEHKTDWSSGPGARWDPAVLDDAGCTRALLPEPGLPWDLAGQLTSAAANHLGLAPGLPVCLGAHDGVCANIGVAAQQVGGWAVTLGTHAVVRTVQAKNGPARQLFYDYPPNSKIYGGNALLGGRAVDWFLANSGAGQTLEAAYSQYDQGALEVESDGAMFLPFLAGQAAPERRPEASGAFVGLRLQHESMHLYRAVLEGVAYALRAIYDDLADTWGAADSLHLTGSGTRSDAWLDILANVINRPLRRSDAAVECRGAAMCLATALGRYRDIDEAVREMVKLDPPRHPTPSRVERYAEGYETWCRAREALVSI